MIEFIPYNPGIRLKNGMPRGRQVWGTFSEILDMVPGSEFEIKNDELELLMSNLSRYKRKKFLNFSSRKIDNETTAIIVL